MTGSNLQPRNYGSASYRLEFNGPACLIDGTTGFFEPSLGSSGAEFVFGGAYTTRHSFMLNLVDNAKFYTTVPDILPDRDLECRYAWDGKAHARNTFLDLQGHDQKIGNIDYRDTATIDGIEYVNESVIKSTGGLATLKVRNSTSNASIVPYMGGHISLYAYPTTYNNGPFTFSKGGDTTGWIGTEKNTMIFTSEAKYPNLGGVECTGAGSVVVRAGATLNPEMTLDIHDVTGNGIRLATGVSLTVKHAFVEGVDLPAGTYCRTGAGIEGATEVAWLKKASTDTDDMTGTVTVSEHDPVWIWTGKGSTSSFSDPANWGANAAPDLADANLTLNFKNAAGQADAVIPLDGVIAPAGAFNCGDYSKGAVSFGGTGTLVLGGTDNDLKMVFTESASLTWNGTGTLHLTGKSTSTGTLTVNSGTVVLDSAGWIGSVVVANGAELVVNASCGSEVFGAADAEANTCSIALTGKLTLADGIAASVKALTVNGQPVRYGKTYGSSASAAVRKNDVHFGGTGTIVSYTHGGILLIIR